jgi:hypothetical protein
VLPDSKVSEPSYLKPGHWTTVSQMWQANTDDVRGELQAVSSAMRSSSGASARSLDDVVGYRVTRPAILPKGQAKTLELRMLIPALGGDISRIDIRSQLRSPQIGLPIEGTSKAISSLQPHEYFAVILTGRPERFAAIQTHDWVRSPKAGAGPGEEFNYRLVFPETAGVLPLPDTFFEWTSTAYLIWDDIEPQQLTSDQRRAIADWVHWGGQIIVNGPAAAEALAGSEVASLLPVAEVRGTALEAEPLGELLGAWTVPTDSSAGTVRGLLENGTQRLGVAGSLAPGARDVPRTGSMVLERRAGRGRVCLTRFDLTADWLAQWNSAAAFFHSVLLRKPPRTYAAIQGVAAQQYSGAYQGREQDARLATSLRILSRDWLGPAAYPSAADREERQGTPDPNATAGPSRRPVAAAGWLGAGEPNRVGESCGAWNPESAVSQSAFELLRDQAGISVPSIAFVAKSLAWYLLILVPLNYLVFALLGKLEWAWLAVPVIGLGGAAWIARSAQLDIGFARSLTEVNVLELQPGYRRGHVSRYMALYNSLSSRYDFHFDRREAVAALVTSEEQAGGPIFAQAFEEGVSLNGVRIPSNQTSTLQAEQIAELAGTIDWERGGGESAPARGSDGGRVLNGSGWSIYDAVLVVCDPAGAMHYDYLGLLESGGNPSVRLSEGTLSFSEPLPLAVDRLMGQLVSGRGMAPGTALLVGRIEERLPGLRIEPAISQYQSQTVVVAHLLAPPIPTPVRDANLRSDIREDEFDGLVEDFSESAAADDGND